MKLWKTLLSWVRRTQARTEINIIELKKWKLEIHIPDIMIFLLKCISSTNGPNPLTFIPSWKCYPNAGQAGGQFSYSLYIVHIIDIFCHLSLLLKLSMKFEMLDFIPSKIELQISIIKNNCTRTDCSCMWLKYPKFSLSWSVQTISYYHCFYCCTWSNIES